MNEDYITFDFVNGKIKVHNNGETGILTMPDLSEKRSTLCALWSFYLPRTASSSHV